MWSGNSSSFGGSDVSPFKVNHPADNAHAIAAETGGTPSSAGINRYPDTSPIGRDMKDASAARFEDWGEAAHFQPLLDSRGPSQEGGRPSFSSVPPPGVVHSDPSSLKGKDNQRSSVPSAGDALAPPPVTAPSPFQRRALELHAANHEFSQQVRAMAKSGAEDEALVKALRDSERQAALAQNQLAQAEAAHAKELAKLTKALEEEQAARAKAEKDMEELLDKAVVTPGTTPRASCSVLTSPSLSGGVEGAAAASSVTSDTFWQKMREREDCARARVRKEFIQQSQNKLHEEKAKRGEAERVSLEADRRAKQAEERYEAQKQQNTKLLADMELAKVELHERALQRAELERKISLLERQVTIAEKQLATEQDGAVATKAQLEELARQREEALEAQRSFARQLQLDLGVKDRDLLDKTAAHGGVLAEIKRLQSRCATQAEEYTHEAERRQADFDTAISEKDALIETQRHQYTALQDRWEKFAEDAQGTQTLKEKHTHEMEEQRKAFGHQLGSMRIEMRSMELQLEKATHAAGRLSREMAAQREAARQDRESFLRRYTAEATALEEELDHTRAQLQRTKEKHLREVLELSEELTQLKENNAKLTYAIANTGHDKEEATRLLMDARAEVGQLRKERGSTSNTFSSHRLRSVACPQSAGGKLILEGVKGNGNNDSNSAVKHLEAVRDELTQQLQFARAQVDRLINERDDARAGLNNATRSGAVRGGGSVASSSMILDASTASSAMLAGKLQSRCAALEHELAEMSSQQQQRRLEGVSDAAFSASGASPLFELVSKTCAAVEEQLRRDARANAGAQQSGGPQAISFTERATTALKELRTKCLEVIGYMRDAADREGRLRQFDASEVCSQKRHVHHEQQGFPAFDTTEKRNVRATASVVGADDGSFLSTGDVGVCRRLASVPRARRSAVLEDPTRPQSSLLSSGHGVPAVDPSTASTPTTPRRKGQPPPPQQQQPPLSLKPAAHHEPYGTCENLRKNENYPLCDSSECGYSSLPSHSHEDLRRRSGDHSRDGDANHDVDGAGVSSIDRHSDTDVTSLFQNVALAHQAYSPLPHPSPS